MDGVEMSGFGAVALGAEAVDRLVAARFASDDFIERRRAFMDKRAPVFRGR